MKKLQLLIFSAFICIHINAQTYRQQFDKLDQTLFTDNFLKYNNFGEALHNVTSYLMRSYIIMYRKTSDIKYLNKFIITSKRVMDRRDDNLDNYKNAAPNCPSCTFSPEPNSKGWATNGSGLVNFMESGTITCPMAEFILLMQEHPELDDTPLPYEALSTTPGLNGLNCYASGAIILTFKQYYRDWLKPKVYDTMSWEYNYWNQNTGFFGNSPGGDSDDNHGINQQAAMGYTLLLCHKIAANDDDNTADAGFLTLAREVATHLYDVINQYSTNISNGVPWIGWHSCLSGDNKDLTEDISHANLDIQMIEEMVNEGMPTYANPYQYFVTQHMVEFANTFLYHVMAIPKTMSMNVYGGNAECWGMCDGYRDNGVTRDAGYYFAGEYTYLCQYDHAIYQAVSDIYSPNQKIDNKINSVFGPNGVNGLAMMGLAQLTKDEHIFNPLTVKDSTGVLLYTGAASGDFDGDGRPDLASMNIVSGNSVLQSYSVNSTSTISPTSNFIISGGNFKYLAAGDIVSSNPGDELVSIDVQNNLLVLFKVQGNTFVPMAQISIGNGSNIVGVAVGEFTSDIYPNNYPGKEILLATANGYINLYGYNPNSNNLDNLFLSNNFSGLSSISGITIGNLQGTGQPIIAVESSSNNLIELLSIANNSGYLTHLVSSFSSNQSNQWTGITTGDFDGDGTDELMLYNQSDGAFQIYRVQAGNIITLKGKEFFPTNQGNGIMCKAHLDNYPQSDALATFRTYDGQISIFNMDGFCPGLNLINQDINSSTSLGNNYPIDYHVNNTLVAGNNFNIYAPSNVDMSAGKEIDFKPGFTASAGSDLHAYIAPGLACNPQTFRKLTVDKNNKPPQQYTAIERAKPIVNNNISITPNPNIGTFQISVTKNNEAINVKDVKVYDLIGKVIWENKAVSGNIFNVDISGYAPGIYYVRAINEAGDIEIKKLIKQ